MKNKIIVTLLFFPILLCLSFWMLNVLFELKSTNIKNFVSGSVLFNPDFKDGFKCWNLNEGISITNINNETYIHVKGNKKQQTRFWQDINVTSGKVYSLEFYIKGKQSGAFVTYRERQTGDEKYLYCKWKGENDEKKFTWDINTISGGNNIIRFAVYEDGDYYFKGISLCEKGNKNILKLVLVIAFIFLLSFLISLIIFVTLYFSHYNNVIFTVIILIVMTIPIFKINMGNISGIENRTLTRYKPLFETNNGAKIINKNYGVDFNNFINDRFFLRENILKYYNYGRMIFNDRFENDFILAGKDRFYFRRSDIKNTINFNKLIDQNYQDILSQLKKLKKFCFENGIDFYIIVLPFSSEVYKEKLIGINIDNYAGGLSNIINVLNNDLKTKNILYAFDCLRAAKSKGLVYFKVDHHWTPLGAYQGYKLVMEEIIQKYTNISIMSEADYNITSYESSFTGSCVSQMALDKKYYEKAFSCDFYLKYTFPNNDLIFGNWKPGDDNTIIKNQKGADYKVFLLGDSFISYYYSFFTHTFNETSCNLKFNQIYMPDYEGRIVDFKPNILIINVYAENFKRIKNWYPMR